MNLLWQVRWTIFITLLINAAAMLSPLINSGDSITYAAISQHIELHDDWASLVLDGQDWLDKPHMPFWITALFFKFSGVSAFTYILPGFLLHLVGGYYTYRIARLFYGRDVAWLSVLVYVSAYQLMDSSVEVKAETYLTGFIMGACYYWLRYDAQTRLKYLLLGALFSASALMTKGLFTLITISSGLLCMWLYHKQWHKLWSAKWLLALALSLLFAIPEIVALYLQFDMHPEKVVFGQTHVSGIKFFFWDSQFGRFFNFGPIQNHGGHPFYFVLVFLWAFLPWVAVFIAALYSGLRQFFGEMGEEHSGFVFLCGAFFVTFLLFSATSFQLDHYTVILFPFAAIVCGKFLSGQLDRLDKIRTLVIAQLFISSLLLMVVAGLSIYVANTALLVVVLTLVGAGFGYGYLTTRQMRADVVLIYPVIAVNVLYVFLVLTTALTFASCDLAYNASKQLGDKRALPVYVYQMREVERELRLYSRLSTYAVDDLTHLSTTEPYFLLIREAQFAQLSERLGQIKPVARGRWIVHKTGTFPKLLRMARGVEPLEDICILEVNAAD